MQYAAQLKAGHSSEARVIVMTRQGHSQIEPCEGQFDIEHHLVAVEVIDVDAVARRIGCCKQIYINEPPQQEQHLLRFDGTTYNSA